MIPFVPAEGIQIGQLAKLAKVRKQTMAQSVEQLVASGYVRRGPDPSDRRASLIFLTEAGRALGPTSLVAGRKVEEGWAEVVGTEELEQVRRALIRLLGLT
ncbi:MarR family winged helix-turn-helix transcriptional regulator [Cryptosporangium phraense]|uniref:MarR family winged helix-turn-helix transcriptional regulator n=1 Tax=Cryptosporangium phraense TaxID=2593070 RepID=UPI001478F8B4|nr:MarR family transcriptional regulator [Cryptosporangium phraense]